MVIRKRLDLTLEAFSNLNDSVMLFLVSNFQQTNVPCHLINTQDEWEPSLLSICNLLGSLPLEQGKSSQAPSLTWLSYWKYFECEYILQSEEYHGAYLWKTKPLSTNIKKRWTQLLLCGLLSWAFSPDPFKINQILT